MELLAKTRHSGYGLSDMSDWSDWSDWSDGIRLAADRLPANRLARHRWIGLDAGRRRGGMKRSAVMSKPCVFFDRDGIVNVPPDPVRYVTSVERFVVIPAFVEALRVVCGRGYEAVVVTNQRGVALGEMSREEVDRIHRRLGDVLAAEGLALRDILVCVEDDDLHPWRKPNPGMLLEAAQRHDLDLARSWMIGDSERDVEAGKRAGCRTIRVAPADVPTQADVHLPDMGSLPGYLARVLGPAGGDSA